MDFIRHRRNQGWTVYFFWLLVILSVAVIAEILRFFELLRRPIEFPCTRQENYFVSKIPKGLPWQDFVLSIEGQFLSKLKDIGVQKGIKSADDKNDFIFFDIAPIESSLSFDERVKLGQGKLIYSPWFRFVVEPMDFNNIYERSRSI